jgi:hypothetical protein
MNTSAQALFEAATLQSVAESYLDGLPASGSTEYQDELVTRLRLGTNHYRLNRSGDGTTRLTDAQIDWFMANYDIVDHYQNDSTGFSAPIFRKRDQSEASGAQYTLSLRSTEYQNADIGGDFERDGFGRADGRNVGAAATARLAVRGRRLSRRWPLETVAGR